jgi:hypothetical protein
LKYAAILEEASFENVLFTLGDRKYIFDLLSPREKSIGKYERNQKPFVRDEGKPSFLGKRYQRIQMRLLSAWQWNGRHGVEVDVDGEQFRLEDQTKEAIIPTNW